MSLFKSILGVAAPIIGGVLGGPAGAAIGGAIGGAINKPKVTPLQPMAFPVGIPDYGPQPVSMPGVTRTALPALGPLAAAAGGMVVRGAGAAARGAVAWCRRNPAWCSSIGGTAAVAGMIESGQLPMPRRRRGRGISGRDLRAYRRVHNLLAGFCAPKARIRKVC
jgi:hypothetical protein